MADRNNGPPGYTKRKSIPTLLPGVPVEPPNGVIFPGRELRLRFTAKQLASYKDWFVDNDFFIAVPKFPDNQRLVLNGQEVKVGVLGKKIHLEPVGDEIVLHFNGLFRVRYILIRSDTVKWYNWGKMQEVLIPDGTEGTAEFVSQLEHLEELFGELWERIQNKELLLSQQFVQDVLQQFENLGPQNLAMALDGIMNILVHAVEGMDITLPAMLILQEERALARLGEVQQLLFYLLHGQPLHNQQPSQLPPADIDKIREELVSVLFENEAPIPEISMQDRPVLAETRPDPTTSTPDHLEIPKDQEPLSIAKMIEYLTSRVIGQERPVRFTARALNLIQARALPREGPLIVLYLAGPTSVGKTEFALALADWLWELEKGAWERAKTRNTTLPFSKKDITNPPLVEVDCEQFSGEMSHGVSNLIGSPAGFVGSKDDRHGTQPPVFRQENFPLSRLTVLLLDEFEKAFQGARNEGAELMGILMKIFAKGVITNNWGEIVDFRNTIVIITSNVGSVKIMQSAKGADWGFRSEREEPKKRKKKITEEEIELLNEKIYPVTRKEYEITYKPEFRNRIHRMIVFHFLTYSAYRKILDKEFREIVQRWAESVGIQAELSDEAKEWILQEIDFEDGVRQLREQFIKKEVLAPLTRAFNLGLLERGKTYLVRTKKVQTKNRNHGRNGQWETQADFWIKE